MPERNTSEAGNSEPIKQKALRFHRGKARLIGDGSDAFSDEPSATDTLEAQGRQHEQAARIIERDQKPLDATKK